MPIMNTAVIRGVTEAEVKELPSAQLENQYFWFSGVEGSTYHNSDRITLLFASDFQNGQ